MFLGPFIWSNYNLYTFLDFGITLSLVVLANQVFLEPLWFGAMSKLAFGKIFTLKN